MIAKRALLAAPALSRSEIEDLVSDIESLR